MPSELSIAPLTIPTEAPFALPSLDDLLTNETALTENLERVLAAAQADSTRAQACRLLHELWARLEADFNPRTNLSWRTVPLTCTDGTLRLLLHPAVFSPEDWSQTFAEGLLQDMEIYKDKTVVELGTGCGCIGLLLLMTTEARSVLGLDINPVAVLMARINTWLNGTTPDGELIASLSGRPLVEAFTAEVSDLLALPMASQQKFDHVIGCIPQVLHPDPAAWQRLSERPSQQDLYDLSNYCFEQGILEDRYGLPLIARALEETHLCLQKPGMVTLMMGGRPGRTIIESMFARRGYASTPLWTTRIAQAGDTDVGSLAKLESSHGISFEFFLAPDSPQAVPASQASVLQQQGQPVYHDLHVYRARPV